jgi:hypothetical protein
MKASGWPAPIEKPPIWTGFTPLFYRLAAVTPAASSVPVLWR